MTLLKACADCGDLTDRARCTTCRPPDHELSASRRGYDSAWVRLSRRARRLQPWCIDCGTSADLTVDHSTQAWERHAAGLEIRLEDVAVVCRPCNSRRGRARPTPGDPSGEGQRPPGKAKCASHLGIILNKEVG